MQYISIENLDIGDFKVGDAIDHDVAGIVFLSASLCIETRSVEDDSKNCIR